MAVVEAGSFTRGARSLGITQPSLSQHIRSPTAGAFVEVLREARQPPPPGAVSIHL